MKPTVKSLSRIVLILASAMTASCSKEAVREAPVPDKDGKVFITVNGQLGEFNSDDRTRADLATVVRVSWTGSETVYVYEGATCLGHVDAPASIDDDRVAELSGTITAPENDNAVLTFVYSNLFAGEPAVTDSKITVDMTTQSLGDGKIPFVIYGFANYSSTAVSGLVIPFKFATSAITASVSNLTPDKAITSAVLSGVNTKCELTLGNGNVTAAGSTEGSVTRNAGMGDASSRGTAFIKLAVPVSGTAGKSLQVTQGATIHFDNGFASNAIGAGRSINVVNLLSHGYDCIDLGLSVKWAAYNVGATKPEEYGDYFAWGETEPYYEDGYAQEIPMIHWKYVYHLEREHAGYGYEQNGTNYKWRESGSWYYLNITLSKYVTESTINYNSGYFGPIDGKTVLEENDDVAQVKWGNGWRMPTADEFKELISSCDITWTDDYNGTGKAGMIVTSRTNGNSIFLPAAGYRENEKLINGDGDEGGIYRIRYWSSSLASNYPLYARIIHYNQDSGYLLDMTAEMRWYGLPVRPVLDLTPTSSTQ